MIHGLVRGTGIYRISHIAAYAAHQGGLVLWYDLGRPAITSGIGNWSVFVFTRMAFCIRDNREMRRARTPRLRCHRGSGTNKVASLVRLLRF